MQRALKVRVVGASSPFPPEKLQKGLAVLRGAGFDLDDALFGAPAEERLRASGVLLGAHAYLNGSDDERVAAVDAALAADVDVVWFARGGYGLTRIVDRLTIPARAPLLVGFSDVTALFARLKNEGQAQRCIHGPLCTSIAGEDADSVAHVVDVVGGAGFSYARLQQQVAGNARGRLFAGNLCVLAALCGTAQQPDLRGHVVVVEEVGERPYRLDRMLTQCLQAGVFDGVSGVVVGHLTDCEEPAGKGTFGRAPAPRALDVVVERLATLGVPVWSGLPAGHEAPNLALPLGREVVVEGGALVVAAADRAGPA